MAKVMFLLDEVEELAGTCVRTEFHVARTPQRRSARDVPPALEVWQGEHCELYLCNNTPNTGTNGHLQPVAYTDGAWRRDHPQATELMGMPGSQLPQHLGVIPLRGPECDLLHLLREGLASGFHMFVVDYVDGSFVASIGKRRYRHRY